MRTSPAKFVRQVRQEVSKVTWPNKKETMTTTIMVIVMSALAAVFFLVADSVISYIVKFALSLGA